MKRIFILLPLLAASFFIASCDNETKRSLGIVRKTPDEYAVLKHPPLSVPPSFELNPPGDRPQARKADLEVKFTKKKGTTEKKPSDKEVSTKKPSTKSASDGDKKFSSKFKKYKKRSDIRDVISEENAKEEQKQKEMNKNKKESALEVIKGWF